MCVVPTVYEAVFGRRWIINKHRLIAPNVKIPQWEAALGHWGAGASVSPWGQSSPVCDEYNSLVSQLEPQLECLCICFAVGEGGLRAG